MVASDEARLHTEGYLFMDEKHLHDLHEQEAGRHVVY
jgi:hypothetical protein